MDRCRWPRLSLWLVALIAINFVGITRANSQEGNTTQTVNSTVIPSGNPTTAQLPEITSVTTLKTTLIEQTQTNKDQTPLFGNSWKFTVGIAVLALCISMLIVCGFKGPSWYKLFHNYRHRRLQDEDEDAVSTVYSKTETHLRQHTFTFQQEGEQMEEVVDDQDDYFEDPYIKSHQQSNEENDSK